jgi:hypothetical protein
MEFAPIKAILILSAAAMLRRFENAVSGAGINGSKAADPNALEV